MPRPKPVTVCTVCGKVGYSLQFATDACGRIHDDKLCHGINQTATQFNDWRECTVCKGEGRNLGTNCKACDGSGWVFVRGRTWHREDP
jgi:hypothetical protein